MATLSLLTTLRNTSSPMWKFSYPGLEPVETLIGVPLPFKEYSSDYDEDIRPIVNIYRYRFVGNRGVEICTNKMSWVYTRYLMYCEDSNDIESASRGSFGFRQSAKDLLKSYDKGATMVYNEERTYGHLVWDSKIDKRLRKSRFSHTV